MVLVSPFHSKRHGQPIARNNSTKLPHSTYKKLISYTQYEIDIQCDRRDRP